jgi:hypothetical protein
MISLLMLRGLRGLVRSNRSPGAWRIRKQQCTFRQLDQRKVDRSFESLRDFILQSRHLPKRIASVENAPLDAGF